MSALDPLGRGEFEALARQVRALSTQSPLGNSAITSGALRVASAEGLIVQGSARVTGVLNGDGTITWSGPWNLVGDGIITGDTQITGPLTVDGITQINGPLGLDGPAFLRDSLTIEPGGAIYAGNLTIDDGGPSLGRVTSSGQLGLYGVTIYLGASTTVNGPLGVNGDINATGDVYGSTKSFLIPHPTLAGRQLRYGSLEGPEHGFYDRGEVVLDASGEGVYELPAYFTALVHEDDEPTVQVTAIGRPFATGAERVADGQVIVYGDPGRTVSVLVVAARLTFDVEPEAPEPQED